MDPALKNIEYDGIEEDNTNDNTQQPSTDFDYDTSFDNGVDGRDTYQYFKKLLICESLDEVNVFTLKLMELLSLEKMDKGTASSAEKFKSGDEMWFRHNKKNPSKEGVTDENKDIYI